MSSVPKVVFKVNYFNYKNGNEKFENKRKYYSSNMSKDYMNYIATGIDEMKKLDYVDYMENSQKSRGVFGENGLLSSEERKNIKINLRKTKSVIWDCLISFESEFGKKWCDNFSQAHNIMKTEFPKFLKRCGFDKNNITWFAGLHENTDNRHIHICFFENKPSRIRKGHKQKQYSIGKISNIAMSEFKAQIELAATDFKAREILARKNINEAFHEQCGHYSTKLINNKFLKIANSLPRGGSLSYASRNMNFLRGEIDSLTNYLIKTSPAITAEKENFLDLAKHKDEMFEDYCRRNHCEKPFNFQDKYKKDIYRRLGNIVIDYALDLKRKDDERLKLNAKIRKEKFKQKRSLWDQVDYCMYLSNKFNYESMQAFKEHMQKLEEIRYSMLVEQNQSDYEM